MLLTCRQSLHGTTQSSSPDNKVPGRFVHEEECTEVGENSKGFPYRHLFVEDQNSCHHRRREVHPVKEKFFDGNVGTGLISEYVIHPHEDYNDSDDERESSKSSYLFVRKELLWRVNEKVSSCSQYKRGKPSPEVLHVWIDLTDSLGDSLVYGSREHHDDGKPYPKRERQDFF